MIADNITYNPIKMNLNAKRPVSLNIKKLAMVIAAIGKEYAHHER